MNADEHEEAVLEYLERRARGDAPSPAAFVEAHGGDAQLLAALHAALEAEARLAAAGPASPQHIGPYRVVATLGRGGMGVVYEVERDGARFALKRAHSGSARARARFEREARLLARIDHPAVVAVREHAEHDGEPCLVMELVRGRALPEGAEGLDLRARTVLVAELCDALECVHRAGLLHRDVKPQNVLLRDGVAPVLVDFGLGTAAEDPSLTSSGDLLGTPRYMAPEVALGAEPGVAADVWGLGQVLYELCQGRPAIAEGSRAAVLRDVARGRVAAPEGLPRALRRVLAVALARRPHRRYAGAAELGRDLRRFLAGEPVEARPAGVAEHALDLLREHPWRAGGLTAAALATATLLGALALSRRADDAERRNVARRELGRAVVAWSLGERDAARRALLASAEHADGEAARALAARLGSDDATLALATLELGAPLAPVLEARELRLRDRLEDARAVLARAPDSGAARAESAALWRAADEPDRALEELREAVRLDPEDALLARLLAEALLESGEWNVGVELARDALRRGAGEGQPAPPALAKLLLRAAGRAGVREVLERRLDADPDESDSRFALAVLLDADHRLPEAAAEYAALLEREPSHAWAAAYLSHLRAGADGERCENCRSAFALHPELVDREEAGRLLARALEHDRGRDGELLRTLVYLARDHDLVQPARVAVDALLAGDRDDSSRARLEQARAGLREGTSESGSGSSDGR